MAIEQRSRQFAGIPTWVGEFAVHAWPLIEKALETLERLRYLDAHKFSVIFERDKVGSCIALIDLREVCHTILDGGEIRLDAMFSVVDFESFQPAIDEDLVSYAEPDPTVEIQQACDQFRLEVQNISALMQRIASPDGQENVRDWLCAVRDAVGDSNHLLYCDSRP